MSTSNSNSSTNSTPFSHLFTQQSKQYALARPDYPPSLYDALYSYVSEKSVHKDFSKMVALDLACGTGQATTALAQKFGKVIGIDISKQQIEEAQKKDNIKYLQGSDADLPSIASQEGPFDLVTVAQAFHWFDFDKSLENIKTSLKDETGVCAIWCYKNPQFENKEADDLVNQEFYLTLLGEYWSDRRTHIDDNYERIEKYIVKHMKDLKVDRSSIYIEQTVPIKSFITYLSSWSAYQTYLQKNPTTADPLPSVQKRLCDILGKTPEDFISVKFPVQYFFSRK